MMRPVGSCGKSLQRNRLFYIILWCYSIYVVCGCTELYLDITIFICILYIISLYLHLAPTHQHDHPTLKTFIKIEVVATKMELVMRAGIYGCARVSSYFSWSWDCFMWSSMIFLKEAREKICSILLMTNVCKLFLAVFIKRNAMWSRMAYVGFRGIWRLSKTRRKCNFGLNTTWRIIVETIHMNQHEYVIYNCTVH